MARPKTIEVEVIKVTPNTNYSRTPTIPSSINSPQSPSQSSNQYKRQIHHLDAMLQSLRESAHATALAKENEDDVYEVPKCDGCGKSNVKLSSHRIGFVETNLCRSCKNIANGAGTLLKLIFK